MAASEDPKATRPEAPAELKVASPYDEAQAKDAVRPAVSDDPVVDDAHLAESVRVGVEAENFPTRVLTSLILATIGILTVVVIVVSFWVAGWFQTQAEIQASAATYPSMQQTRVEATRVLESYGVISEEDGVYRIPIDRAMDLIVDEAYTAGRETSNP